MSAALGLRVATCSTAKPPSMTVDKRWPTSVRWAAVAITLHFFVSSSLLFICGINYDVPGGNPLIKFHPSTYVVLIAAAFALKERRQGRTVLDALMAEAGIALCFVLAMTSCSIFAEVSIGTRGAAVFIENFVSAGLLAYVLTSASASDRQGIGRLMLVLTLINVVVAIGETMTQTHVVPPFIGGVSYVEETTDFRGTAGFEHPLTGAFVTMMTLLCLPRLRIAGLWSPVSFGLLSVGLLAFGGRTALLFSIIGMIFLAGRSIALGLSKRRLSGKLVASVLLALLVVPPAGYAVLNYTPIGIRIASHFFVDESAETRSVQWRVMDKISLQNELFGVPEDEIPFLIRTVDLDQKLGAIENPWLLIYLKLGVVGCSIFLAGMIPLLLQFWSRSTVEGRLVLLAGLIVMSSSNSVGVKSNVFFLFVAFLMSASDYAAPPGLQQAIPPARANALQASLNTALGDGRRTGSPGLRPL